MKKTSSFKIELAPTLTGHWYKVGKKYYPSVTQILTAYPQSLGLQKWVADHGWEESQAIKGEAGERGTRVHEAIERLLKGAEMDRENYSLEEWWKINTFWQWYKDVKPKIQATEIIVFNKKHGFAGRVDCIYKINGKLVLIDFKTSSSIYDQYPLQVAAYAYAYETMFKVKIDHTAILQLGAKNKNGYRFQIHDDWQNNFKSFLDVKGVFNYQYGKDYVPQILELPQTIKL